MNRCFIQVAMHESADGWEATTRGNGRLGQSVKGQHVHRVQRATGMY